MDDLSEIFPSNTLKAADLKGRKVRLCIATATPKQFNNGDNKVLITFQNTKKVFVCNQTNARKIGWRYGPKISGWTGKEIILYAELKNFQGKMVEGLSVMLPDLPEDTPEDISALSQKGNVMTQQHSGVVTSTTDRHPNAPGNDFHSDDIPF
jgi:hypothetical protein